jgi:hypothetical protein
MSPLVVAFSLLLGPVASLSAETITVYPGVTYPPTFKGFGGNMAKHREDSVPSNMLANGTDKVGQYCLDNLSVKHVRIGMPLGGDGGDGVVFDPSKTLANQHANVKHVINLMKTMKTMAIPFSMGIWNLPDWMVSDSDPTSEGGRFVRAGKEPDVANYIYRFLKMATDNGGGFPDGISFNEATETWGNDIAMPAATLNTIMTELANLNPNVKWILSDTGANKGDTYARQCWNALSTANRARVIAVSYHGWKSETVLDVNGENFIVNLRLFAESIGLPLWCLEIGEDPTGVTLEDLDTWAYASRLAKNYFYAFKHGRVKQADYWEYMSDFRLTTDSNGTAFNTAGHLVKMLTDEIRPGMTMVNSAGTGNGGWPVAFKDLVNGRFRVLFINTVGTQSFTFNSLPAGTYTWKQCRSGVNNVVRGTFNVTNGTLTLPTVEGDSVNILSKPTD